MPRISMLYYPAVKTADASGGGSTTTVGTPREFWGAVAVHENEITLDSVLLDEGLQVDGYVELQDQWYRITGRTGPMAGRFVQFTLEATDRPIVRDES
jgi:hypothetical protein